MSNLILMIDTNLFWLTWWQVHPIVASSFCHVDADHHSAVLQGDLQGAVVEIAEHEEPVRVPRAELEAKRYGVMTSSARQLQEAGGVEEDREGVSLHTGEGQVTLLGQFQRGKKTETGSEPSLKSKMCNQS